MTELNWIVLAVAFGAGTWLLTFVIMANEEDGDLPTKFWLSGFILVGVAAALVVMSNLGALAWEAVGGLIDG